MADGAGLAEHHDPRGCPFAWKTSGCWKGAHWVHRWGWGGLGKAGVQPAPAACRGRAGKCALPPRRSPPGLASLVRTAFGYRPRCKHPLLQSAPRSRAAPCCAQHTAVVQKPGRSQPFALPPPPPCPCGTQGFLLLILLLCRSRARASPPQLRTLAIPSASPWACSPPHFPNFSLIKSGGFTEAGTHSTLPPDTTTQDSERWVHISGLRGGQQM